MVKKLTFATHSQFELVDLTGQIEDVVVNSGLTDGLCHLFVPHATAALIFGENEPGLIEDLLLKIQSLFPEADYKHNLIDNNARAHLAASFLGQSLTFPFLAQKLVIGTWQSVFFVELDGPRQRRGVVLTLQGIREL